VLRAVYGHSIFDCGHKTIQQGTYVENTKSRHPWRTAIATALLTLFMASPAQAQVDKAVPVSASKDATIRAGIERNTKGKIAVRSISTTPIDGIYAVETPTEVFYVDGNGRYGFAGAALIDMQNQVDLTASHLERVQRIKFDDLPLRNAIKEVRGNGARKLAVFEDPNCPICKVFTKFVDQLDDVTVYKFMFPVIGPESVPLARMAWCSPDRGAAWRAIMAGQRPLGARQDCDTSGLVDILKTGERYSIQNTPTIVLGNGKRLVGATPPEVFMTELSNASR
jgi:thiol:disulfide interchange protein DsbC